MASIVRPHAGRESPRVKANWRPYAYPPATNTMASNTAGYRYPGKSAPEGFGAGVEGLGRGGLDSTVLNDAVATQDMITQLAGCLLR
jgi:hypothetical protein